MPPAKEITPIIFHYFPLFFISLFSYFFFFYFKKRFSPSSSSFLKIPLLVLQSPFWNHLSIAKNLKNLQQPPSFQVKIPIFLSRTPLKSIELSLLSIDPPRNRSQKCQALRRILPTTAPFVVRD